MKSSHFLIPSITQNQILSELPTLTQVHHNRFVYLLPQVSTEDLNEGDLESRNLAMHEDTRQIQLNLETNVDICAVNCWGPPKSETTVRNLIQTTTLGIGQFFVLRRSVVAMLASNTQIAQSAKSQVAKMVHTFMLSSKPDALSQKRPSQDGK